MDSKMEQRELMSALVDGQLRGEAFARAVETAGSDPRAREAWHTYHLIGDVLRTGGPVKANSPELFLDELARRLASEEPLRASQGSAVAVDVTQLPAANDGSFRWKLVAGFASMAAVAAVGWTMVAGTGVAPLQPQLAGAPVQPEAARAGATLVAGERGLMIRDAQLDEFLAAHRQFGGASALQMPAGFLRNATFEGTSR